MTEARTTKRRRFGVVAGVALALATLGTACDPAPPPPLFTVTATTDAADANPGDGVCEATSGVGNCTLRAAVEEGNALGRAQVVLAATTYPLASNLTVTGNLSVSGQDRVTEITAADPAYFGPDPEVFVAAGGSLVLTQTDVSLVTAVVAGRFVFAQGTMAGGVSQYSNNTLDVDSGGVALLQNAHISNAFRIAVTNSGTLAFDYSTIGGTLTFGGQPLDMGGILTSQGGRTFLRGTWVGSGDCFGAALTSQGYNASASSTCTLSEATDRSAPKANAHTLEPSSELIDAIPVGVGGCGDVTLDIRNETRPLDGDQDGVAACDIGAMEHVPGAPI